VCTIESTLAHTLIALSTLRDEDGNLPSGEDIVFVINQLRLQIGAKIDAHE